MNLERSPAFSFMPALYQTNTAIAKELVLLFILTFQIVSMQAMKTGIPSMELMTVIMHLHT